MLASVSHCTLPGVSVWRAINPNTSFDSRQGMLLTVSQTCSNAILSMCAVLHRDDADELEPQVKLVPAILILNILAMLTCFS